MPAVRVRTPELAACGSDLALGARRLADAVAGFDGRAGAGAGLGHAVAVEAYERFFGAWSLRLHDVVAVLEAGADAVSDAAERYDAWDRYVAGLTR